MAATTNLELMAQARTLRMQADGLESHGQSGADAAAQMRRAADEIESRAMGSALSAKFHDPTASSDPITGFFKSVPLWGWGVGLGVVGILLAGTAYRRSANPRRKRRKSNPASRVPSLADQAKGRAAIRRALKTLEREEAAAKSKSEKSEWARKIKSLRSQLAQIDWDAI